MSVFPLLIHAARQRRDIIAVLSKSQCGAAEIARIIRTDWSTSESHLGCLERFGLVQSARIGKKSGPNKAEVTEYRLTPAGENWNACMLLAEAAWGAVSAERT